MKRFLFCCAFFLLGNISLAAEQRPNIIFVLADDLAQGDLGCYGQKLIQTPNLDRMAAEGTRYTQAYSGTSVCAPSRSSLMTGLDMGHCPIRGNHELKTGSQFGAGQLPLPESTVTVAQVLKSAGYATACVGKWGMGQFDTTGGPHKKALTISLVSTAKCTRTTTLQPTFSMTKLASNCRKTRTMRRKPMPIS